MGLSHVPGGMDLGTFRLTPRMMSIPTNTSARGRNRAGRNLASWSNRNCTPQQTLDISQLVLVFSSHKTCGTTGRLHPSRATDTMDIIFRAIGQIEINHVADIRNIDPSGSNIGRHQHPECSTSETF